jgi:hypothetical protein
MSQVGSSIESLFAVGAAVSESPNRKAARCATSVGETVDVAESVALVVLAGDADVVDGVEVAGLRRTESLAVRFGAPAAITVCGCGAGAGCE